MTITTKAALAAELGISRARVSQYAKAGMPVRADGKLDREAAVTWISRSHVDRLNGRTAGVNRAAAIAMKVRAAKPAAPEPQTDLLVIIAELVGRVGEISARAAVEAGAEMKVACALDAMVSDGLAELANRLLGYPPGAWTDLDWLVEERSVDPD